MLKELIKRCIDINSSYCPCLLADTNHCVYCSQLQGKEFCDCDWQGVCILYENFWQKKCIATNKISRVEEKTQFSIKEKLNEKTYIIAEKVGYSDPNYFSYVFKKQFGMPPSKYKAGKVEQS